MIFPLLEGLGGDDKSILRQHLAEQLTGLTEVAIKSGGEEGYDAVCETILPLLARLLADGVAEVRVSAGEALVAIAGLVKREDLGPRILTLVLALAHDDDAEELRMSAAVLLNELAETLGPELCSQFVTPEVICLAEDPVFRVRKAAAQNLDAICRAAGPSGSLKRLVPTFLRLTQDEIWGVRKACAESLVAVSKTLDPAVRVSDLIPVFERFASDASKWVRNAAFQQLGPFLATLPGPKVSPSLLAHYTRMGMAGDGSSTTGTLARTGSDPADAELAVFCAFSFPAVVLTLGRARWPELRPLFVALSRDVQRKVRRPLGYALHDMARLLGPEAADADLAPALDLFLRDVDEVRAGALRSLGAFLAALPPAARERYAPVLVEVHATAPPAAWRVRRTLAGQLASIVPLVSAAALQSSLVPLTRVLLADTVAAVREEAAGAVPPLLNRLAKEDTAACGSLLASLTFCASSPTYKERVLFVRVALLVAKACPPHFFIRHFAPCLYSLARDSVRNVRLAVAQGLAPLCAPLLAAEGQKGDSGAGASPWVADVDEVMPPWGREEVEAEWAEGRSGAIRLSGSLRAMANDTDVEVLRALPCAYLAVHRSGGIPENLTSVLMTRPSYGDGFFADEVAPHEVEALHRAAREAQRRDAEAEAAGGGGSAAEAYPADVAPPTSEVLEAELMSVVGILAAPREPG
jgi:serine/threonine-protein phosphatase 4 regulatory subunit 1